MTTRRRFYTVLGLTTLALGAVSQEDPEDRWELRNDRVNRYEGRREIPVGRPDLELVSFLGHQERYEEPVDLKVCFFLPQEGPATVYGQEIIDDKQYWMKSKPVDWRAGAWNDFGPWPTYEVLDREAIDAWDLGVYVDLGSKEERRLAPALLYHSKVPERIEVYTFILRPNSSLKRLEYAVTRAEGEDRETLLENRLLGEMRVGEPILLDFDSADLPDETWLRLEVTGKLKGRTDEAFFEARFFHKAGVG